MVKLIQRVQGRRAKRYNLREVDRRQFFQGWVTTDMAFDVNMYAIAPGTAFGGKPAQTSLRWDWYITDRNADTSLDVILQGQAPDAETAWKMAAHVLNDGTVDAIRRRKKLAGVKWD